MHGTVLIFLTSDFLSLDVLLRKKRNPSRVSIIVFLIFIINVTLRNLTTGNQTSGKITTQVIPRKSQYLLRLISCLGRDLVPVQSGRVIFWREGELVARTDVFEYDTIVPYSRWRTGA